MASQMVDELGHLTGNEWIVAWLQRRKDLVAKHNITDDKMAVLKAQAEANYQKAPHEYISLDDATWCLIYESLDMTNPEHTSKMAPQPKKKNAAIHLVCSLLEEKVLVISGLEGKLKEARGEVGIAAKKEKLLKKRLRIMEGQHESLEKRTKRFGKSGGEQARAEKAKMADVIACLEKELLDKGGELRVLRKQAEERQRSSQAQFKQISAIQKKFNEYVKEHEESAESTTSEWVNTITELRQQLKAEQEKSAGLEKELGLARHHVQRAQEHKDTTVKILRGKIEELNDRATVAEGLAIRTSKRPKGDEA